MGKQTRHTRTNKKGKTFFAGLAGYKRKMDNIIRKKEAGTYTAKEGYMAFEALGQEYRDDMPYTKKAKKRFDKLVEVDIFPEKVKF